VRRAHARRIPGAWLRRRAAAALAGALLAGAAPVRAEPELYRWVDDEGHVHFSDTSPVAPDASVRIEPLGLDFGGEPLGSGEAPSTYVRRALAAKLAEIERSRGALRFRVSLPGDWAELDPAGQSAIRRAIPSSSLLLGAFFRKLDREPIALPLIALIAEPGARPDAEMLRAMQDQPPIFQERWLRKAFMSGVKNSSELDNLGFERESQALRAEFTLETSNGKKVRGMLGIVHTREGLAGVIAYAFAGEFSGYRPLFLQIIRSLQVPQELRLFDASAPSSAGAGADAGPVAPIPPGDALGMALALLCAMALLMVYVSSAPALLRWLGAALVVAAAAGAACALARTPDEARTAWTTFAATLAALTALGSAIRRVRRSA
jgi:hypothetical protein